MWHCNKFIIILGLCMAGCRPTQQKQVIKHDPKYSSNEKILFGIDDTCKVLDLDFSVGKDSLFSIVEKELGRKICRDGVDFGVNIGQDR